MGIVTTVIIHDGITSVNRFLVRLLKDVNKKMRVFAIFSIFL